MPVIDSTLPVRAIVGRYYAAGGPVEITQGNLDHGSLSGLGDDDHSQYSLVDGTRAFTGTVGGITPSADADLTTKEYVDDLVIPVDYVPDSINVATGTQDAGDVNSLKVLDDGDSLDVSEVSGVPGYNIEIDFVSILETPTRLDLHVWYRGSSGHTVNVQIFDQVGSTWDTLGTIPEDDGSEDFEYLTYDIINGSKYVKGDNTVETRIYHVSTGNPTHDIFVDYVTLRKIPIGGGGGITDHGALSDLDADDHHQYIHVNGTHPLTSDWDNTSRRIRNTGVAEVAAAAPGTPVAGLFWLDTDAVGSGGSGVLAVNTFTSSDTLTTAHTVALCDATSGNITITLPAAASNEGRRYFIKKIDASVNTVTIDGNASETIDDDATKVLASQYDSLLIVCDGTEWWIL